MTYIDHDVIKATDADDPRTDERDGLLPPDRDSSMNHLGQYGP